MTRSLYQAKVRLVLNLRWRPIGILCLSVLVLSGCAERRARAFPWASAIQARPIPPSDVPIAALTPDLAPDFGLDLPAPPTLLEGPRREPPRPRTNVTATESEFSRGSRTPLLVPQFTPQELADTQQQISESLRIAERNLQAVQGRAINPAQSDLVSKVTSFIAQSREASSEHDWTRASNLAKKAELLSEELRNPQ
jgi:hypothetical protein